MIVNSHAKDEEVEQETELRLVFDRRLKAYGEIADIQLSGILKTVLTYSNIDDFIESEYSQLYESSKTSLLPDLIPADTSNDGSQLHT